MTATGIGPSYASVAVSSLNPELNPVPNCHRTPMEYPLEIFEGMGGTLWPGNLIELDKQ